MKLIFNRKKKQGFTLIEILLVVGFIALAGIGIFVTYNTVVTGNAANTEGNNLNAIRAGTINLFATAQTTYGLTNTVLNNAAVIPEPMRRPPGGIVNSFGGDVTVASLTITNPNDGFRITYTAVPGTVCTRLATGPGSQFNRVTVGTTVVKPFGVNTVVDIPAATVACAADTGPGVTMHFDSLK